MDDFKPAYIESFQSGLLQARADAARPLLKSCRLCPRQCSVDRLGKGHPGVCKTLDKAWVSSFHAHYGEEAPLVGQHGSGTIFFTHCNLLCNFCQNYDISHQGLGQEVTDRQLADMMLSLEREGCHNINFVTPTHVVPQILSALLLACEQGLHVPLVYNSGGYDAVETLQLLTGIFDIYMPDFKFWDSRIADMTCKAPDYPEIARKAILEMHRQVGDLALDENGVAQKGLLLRHLVLPENQAGTREMMRFIANKISVHTYVNIMPKFRHCGDLSNTPQLQRAISRSEYEEALSAARSEGILRLDEPRFAFMMRRV